jgi:hypothetical protein
LVIATLIATSAVAHDNPENWIGQEYRQNPLGQICCGKNDCHAFTVDEVTVMPDGYHFPDGESLRSIRPHPRSIVSSGSACGVSRRKQSASLPR